MRKSFTPNGSTQLELDKTRSDRFLDTSSIDQKKIGGSRIKRVRVSLSITIKLVYLEKENLMQLVSFSLCDLEVTSSISPVVGLFVPLLSPFILPVLGLCAPCTKKKKRCILILDKGWHCYTIPTLRDRLLNSKKSVFRLILFIF